MKAHTYVVWQSLDGWRWKLVATNDKIIAESGEAYSSKRAAKLAAQNVKMRSRTAGLIVQGETADFFPSHPHVQHSEYLNMILWGMHLALGDIPPGVERFETEQSLDAEVETALQLIKEAANARK